ncbi:hypothetical protein SeMB42_g01273 [Synchytrium endobioticum]|uniref:FF domain-containing protein n=1 Tax=Synchytrium endobioticum TaxID=286115 RepID=A0A507CLB4_9FUNG|nr:hypothetical protein SeLEV6574_g07366 [Synchytrium endobioticum]TPX52653.1 hypothetical protein SeMB42_g01273 [Synchytrium endobioticum]
MQPASQPRLSFFLELLPDDAAMSRRGQQEVDPLDPEVDFVLRPPRPRRPLSPTKHVPGHFLQPDPSYCAPVYPPLSSTMVTNQQYQMQSSPIQHQASDATADDASSADNALSIPSPTVNAPSSASGEHPQAMKKIPYCNWAIVLTSRNHEYYIDLDKHEAVWDIPDEISDIIENLMVAARAALDDHHDADGAQAGLPQNTTGLHDSCRKRDREDDGQVPDGGDAKKPRELAREEKVQSFEELLKEKDVDPFAMWEKELPKIINDIRFTYIATLKEKKEIFDEYCKSRSAEIAQQRKSLIKDKKETYVKLLENETNRKTLWDDFQRKFKRDPRFTAIDPKERESAFKEHIKAIKERDQQRQRSQTKVNREAFIELLQSTASIHANSSWRKIQRDIDNDPRYKAISSSTEREDVFRDYLNQLRGRDPQEQTNPDRKAREEAKLKERGEAVRRERAEQRRDVERARGSLKREESVTTFKSLLVDSVRNTNISYTEAQTLLTKDSRWQEAQLNDHDRERLYNEHCEELWKKRLDAFYGLLDSISDLKSTFDDVYPQIQDDPRVTRLGKGGHMLHSIFSKYLAERSKRAEDDLREALRENNFVKFHVKSAVSNSEAKAAESKQDVNESDVWNLISLDEIKQVLKEDKRFLFLSTAPDIRDDILKVHIKNLVRQYMDEKGGARDMTIAQYAGAMSFERGAKGDQQRWLSNSGARIPSVSGAERKKNIIS